MCALVLLVLASVAAIDARPYELEAKPVVLRMDRGYPVEGTRLVLSRRSDRKVIWTRTLEDADVAIAWSGDGRAVSALGSNWTLVVWRDGERVHQAKMPMIRPSFGEPPAYEHKTRWSPDKRNILFVMPRTQGDMDFEHGELGVFDVAAKRMRWTGLTAREASWSDHRTIRYAFESWMQSTSGYDEGDRDLIVKTVTLQELAARKKSSP
jgi:hypothetical protein